MLDLDLLKHVLHDDDEEGFVTAMSDRPFQASEVKIHNWFRMIYSLHTLVVAYRTETLPS